MEDDKALLPTGLKYAVNMEAEGFSMDDDDWKITVYGFADKLEFTRTNSVRDDDGQWYICIDTEVTGAGVLYIQFDAWVPDADFATGLRHERKRFRLIEMDI